MSSQFGKCLKVSLFGESHGSTVGVLIDGFPAGHRVDFSNIDQELDRRRPGKSSFATQRVESDVPRFLSGLLDGRTTGAPICGVFDNVNQRSEDYALLQQVLRPSHADYTAHLRYGGFSDWRGGGHFSGRLTAGMVLAGALAKQVLRAEGIEIMGRITQIGAVKDVEQFLNYGDFLDQIKSSEGMKDSYFPMISEVRAQEAKALIEGVRLDGDSVGGSAEVVVTGFPGGLGSPMFEGVESKLSQVLYGIPAVKGVLFGAGVEFAASRGSQLNDPWHLEGGRVVSATNHNGGINGGITNGMPIQFTAIIKPTPSISKVQRTIALDCLTAEQAHICENAWIELDHQIGGRHDPCIVPRALPVLEAVAALVLLDLWKEGKGYSK